MKIVLMTILQVSSLLLFAANANATAFYCTMGNVICEDKNFYISLDGPGNDTKDYVTLDPGASSSGSFSFSLPLGNLPSSLSSANLNLQFWDLDLFDYNISGVNFYETAVISANSVTIATLDETYAISTGLNDNDTNNKEISFTFNLFDTFIPPANLPSPFTLDVLLETHLKNNNNYSITLSNTRESMAVQLEVKPNPEPGTMLLFGTGLAGLLGSRIRRKKK